MADYCWESDPSRSFWIAKAKFASAGAGLFAHFRGRADTPCNITDNLFLSGSQVEKDLSQLQGAGITHILQVSFVWEKGRAETRTETTLGAPCLLQVGVELRKSHPDAGLEYLQVDVSSTLACTWYIGARLIVCCLLFG
jgi:hypothetical protein